MSKPIIVLKKQGKHESVDYASIHLFNSLTDAQNFCAKENTGKIKHWTNARIVENGELIELEQAQND